MNTALAKLSSSIEKNLLERRTALQPVALVDFNYLQKAGLAISQRFGGAEAAQEPSVEKRRIAIGKFRLSHPLTQSEWRMVFAGLADRDGINLPLLEDNPFFESIHQEVNNRIHDKTLSRRDWLSLCFSYFGYDSAEPLNNPNWKVLRGDIDNGFDAVKQAAAKEREWMRIVDHYRELFSDQAGAQLAVQMFNGEIQDLSSLQAIAQIHDGSWLWRRIFGVLVSRIFTIEDDEFVLRVPGLLKLGQHHTRYMNDIISACLTRYHRSGYRDKPHQGLKQISLEKWGSPQIRSKQNSWLQYVEKPVCEMVSGWFAREDLEHFFSLLQGDNQVDQSRLFYWLRFANQMSYTRIVMGADAYNDRSRDFVNFREKNKDRYSQLTGAPVHNNAVLMQIGNYFFVEFSGTGNACYIYKADTAPFNPEKKYLALTTELKQKNKAIDALRHSPAPSRPKKVEGWLVKFDDVLRNFGIVPRIEIKPVKKVLSEKAAKDTVHPSAHQSVVTGMSPASTPLEEQVQLALKDYPHAVYDNRHKGGSFKVMLEKDNAYAVTMLLRLGFKKAEYKTLLYWRD